MSVNKKNRSLWGSRSEAQRIYYQRETIKRLEKECKELKERIEILKDELEWYKQQCDDLEMQIGCQE